MNSEKYRPANGSEGFWFQENWCDQCERDRVYRKIQDDGCIILLHTLIYDVDHEDYPKEWTYDENGNPCCTAFIAEGEPIPIKDDKTIDMFENLKNE